ncbi:MAG: hypothetical protein H0X25_12910 [Acidobacteriales bacterium]|nr:hypothetical protein [Terriglobales bacterium]
MKCLATILCCVTGLLAPGSAHAQISSFKHVVLIIQENRTPDNLFYALCLPPYGSQKSCSTAPTSKQYNIQTANWLDKTSKNGVTQPSRANLAGGYDLGHLHSAFTALCDKDSNGHCRMDGEAGVTCEPAGSCDGFAHPQFKYVDNSAGTLNPYLDMVTQYGWANYMFQTEQGSTFPSHQYLFGATSAPTADDDHLGTFVSNNGHGVNIGCISAPDFLVQLIDANGVEDPRNKVFPCFEHDTLSDLLDTAGVTWKYYVAGAGGPANAPMDISHLCQPSGGQCTGLEYRTHVVLSASQVLTDIANCDLQQVIWSTPTGDNSDHAGGNDGGGPAWVASIVNAIGNSWANSNHKCDYWGANQPGDETAILLTWDDWGGWYDHESPLILRYPQGGFQLGARVPLVAISAYTPAKTISNARFDFGSMVRFVEQNYGIQEGALTFADSRSGTDLKAFFDLTQVPRVFETIAAPKGAEFFIRDPRPQTDADDY